MKKNKIVVVFSSHLSDKENTNFKNHISETIGCDHKVVCYENKNQYSLAEVYNLSLKHHHNDKNQIFVFVHNDVIFKTKKWGKILLRIFNNHKKSIIGLAGTTYLSEKGIWWDKKECLYGSVDHTDSINTWTTKFGVFKGIKDVIVVDGVFISLNPDDITHGFDESFKGFHFYDLPICFENYLDGHDIGITNQIQILHKSVGMVNEDWEKNRKQFVEKYKDHLPLKI